MTLSITTLGIMALSIKSLYETHSILNTLHNDTQYNDIPHNDTQLKGLYKTFSILETQHNDNQHNDTQHKGLI